MWKCKEYKLYPKLHADDTDDMLLRLCKLLVYNAHMLRTELVTLEGKVTFERNGDGCQWEVPQWEQPASLLQPRKTGLQDDTHNWCQILLVAPHAPWTVQSVTLSLHYKCRSRIPSGLSTDTCQ